MDCEIAREALSARIDGEREPVPTAQIDEHLVSCAACRDWQAAAVEQTRLLRRAAGRSQLAAARTPVAAQPHEARGSSLSWRRWALGTLGVIQLGLAIAQGLGADLGIPHAHEAGHVLNESTAWSAALGVVMLAAAVRPVMAGGLALVLASFGVFLLVYEIVDHDEGLVSTDRSLTHLPVIAGALLAFAVWRKDASAEGPEPDRTAAAGTGDTALPGIEPQDRRGHLRSTDGSAA